MWREGGGRGGERQSEGVGSACPERNTVRDRDPERDIHAQKHTEIDAKRDDQREEDLLRDMHGNEDMQRKAQRGRGRYKQ